MELQLAIKQAEDLAKNGTTEEKAAFVAWACSGIDYLNAQIVNGCGNDDTRKALKAIKAQYNAYLQALNANNNE